VRQLTAVAGDGPLGSVGSPGQLETSLNSGYLVGPCNSYLEGPTLVCLGLAACAIALDLRRRRRRSQRKNASARLSSVRRRAICRRSQPRGRSLTDPSPIWPIPPHLRKPGLTQVAHGLHGLQPMQTARNLRTRRLLASGRRLRDDAVLTAESGNTERTRVRAP
jgi:hypothetical protein